MPAAFGVILWQSWVGNDEVCGQATLDPVTVFPLCGVDPADANDLGTAVSADDGA
jgi:hypothetical protein